MPDTIEGYLRQFVRSQYGPRSANRVDRPASTDEQRLLPENARRTGFIIVNDTDDTLYLGLGAQEVTSSDFTWAIAARETLEIIKPWGLCPQQEVRYLCATSDGSVLVTEIALKQLPDLP